MDGSTHLNAGICVGFAYLLSTAAATATIPSLTSSFAIVSAAGIGSLLPDIDRNGSKIASRLKITSKALSTLFGHRGIIHAPLLYLAIYGVLTICFPNDTQVIQAMALGVASHLLLDMLNVQGIPLLAPLSSQKYKLCKIRTGSKSAAVVARVSQIACCLFFVQYLAFCLILH